jgi:hypothetical protein
MFRCGTCNWYRAFVLNLLYFQEERCCQREISFHERAVPLLFRDEATLVSA